MIKVNIDKNKISISGHSLYDNYGKDIVCASVSSIVICSINAIIGIDEESIEATYSNEEMLIIINKQDKVTKILLDNMLDLLEKLQTDYPKNIKVRRMFNEII